MPPKRNPVRFDPFVDDPIVKIEWRQASKLNGNDWNPNVVMNAELRLLEESILRNGWIQPILVSADGTIIDGFHRWKLALDSKRLQERYGGQVPCSVLDIPRKDAMMLTVRINRAKGANVALRLAHVVQQLVEAGVPPDEIGRGIGANRDEVELLTDAALFKALDLKNARYARAWVPHHVTQKQADAIFEAGGGRYDPGITAADVERDETEVAG